MFRKKIFFAGLFTGILLCLLVLFIIRFVHVSNNTTITGEQRIELIHLGLEAAKQKEVPVASLLLYGNKIIGEGRNSVLADTNIAAHAEVNALNDAIRTIGVKAFNLLNRDSLILISTFEPCPMCIGALAENNITHVVVIQNKSLKYKLKEWKGCFTLQRNTQYIPDDALQDSLFRLFPGVNIKSIVY